MLDPATLTPFFFALIALQLSPGPDMLLVMGRGIGQGHRVAFLTAMGATLLAGLVQLPLLALGVASLIQTSPLAFGFLRWAGAAYLLWLGVNLLRQSERSTEAAIKPASVTGWTALWEGAISNLTNPKVLVFMLAFLPQFVDPNSDWSVTTQLLVLGTIQKLSGFAVLPLVAFGAGRLGNWISRRPNLIVWQKRFTGVVLIGLGLRLAFGGDARPTRA